ncbi:hypothetical protein VTL71DRAFT_5314 [Oculimacula yallundae]|uniref:NADPH-dependent FMN reductase-like domain-containing protein n=1 Tax=Oculimacula yallundae TaxID=86028 RepID=A0ABR4C0Q4_9HELO
MAQVTPQTTPKIALIICSSRTPRVGPDIASWVSSSLSSSTTDPSPVDLTIIDLASFPLPISPCTLPIPARQPLPLSENAYGVDSINAWSREVQQYSGFIFLTPQYNWSFPAVVKCAIDHLYHEWAGKPALVITYGTRGGDKCNQALRQVLNGVRMAEWQGSVLLPTGRGESSDKGVLDEGVWKAWEEGGKREELLARWRELVDLVKVEDAL